MNIDFYQYFGQLFSCFGNESLKFPKSKVYPGFGKSLRSFPKQPKQPKKDLTHFYPGR